eukprot:Gb_32605 [translate_table: standard]
MNLEMGRFASRPISIKYASTSFATFNFALCVAAVDLLLSTKSRFSADLVRLFSYASVVRAGLVGRLWFCVMKCSNIVCTRSTS